MIIGLPGLGSESPSTFASNSKISVERLIGAKMVIPEYYNDDDCCPVEIYSEAIANFQTLVDECNQIETHDIDTVLVDNLNNIAMFHENEDDLILAVTKMLQDVFETMGSQHKRKYTITAELKSIIESPTKKSFSTLKYVTKEYVKGHRNPGITITEENEEQYPPEVFFEVANQLRLIHLLKLYVII